MTNIFEKSKLPAPFILVQVLHLLWARTMVFNAAKIENVFLLCCGVVSYSMTANLKSYPTAVSKFDLGTKHIATDF